MRSRLYSIVRKILIVLAGVALTGVEAISADYGLQLSQPPWVDATDADPVLNVPAGLAQAEERPTSPSSPDPGVGYQRLTGHVLEALERATLKGEGAALLDRSRGGSDRPRILCGGRRIRSNRATSQAGGELEFERECVEESGAPGTSLAREVSLRSSPNALRSRPMNSAQLRLFLLRRLPADETERMEDSILTEAGLAERLREAEFDLLDDYAASRLSANDAADVKRYVLRSQESLNSLRVAKALVAYRAAADHIRRDHTPRRLVTARFATWGASLVAACLIAIAIIPTWHATPTAARPLPAPTSLPVIALIADANRGTAPQPLRLPSGGKAFVLQTEVPEQQSDTLYTITLNDAAGRSLFSASALRARTAGPYRFVEAVVPLTAVGQGNRSVVLTASGAGGSRVEFTWRLSLPPPDSR